MDFFERLTKERKIKGINPHNFGPYEIELKQPRFEVGYAVTEENFKFWPVYVYDGDQFIGTYKYGEKISKGITSYPTAFIRHQVETVV